MKSCRNPKVRWLILTVILVMSLGVGNLSLPVAQATPKKDLAGLVCVIIGGVVVGYMIYEICRVAKKLLGPEPEPTPPNPAPPAPPGNTNRLALITRNGVGDSWQLAIPRITMPTNSYVVWEYPNTTNTAPDGTRYTLVAAYGLESSPTLGNNAVWIHVCVITQWISSTTVFAVLYRDGQPLYSVTTNRTSGPIDWGSAVQLNTSSPQMFYRGANYVR